MFITGTKGNTVLTAMRGLSTPPRADRSWRFMSLKLLGGRAEIWACALLSSVTSWLMSGVMFADVAVPLWPNCANNDMLTSGNRNGEGKLTELRQNGRHVRLQLGDDVENIASTGALLDLGGRSSRHRHGDGQGTDDESSDAREQHLVAYAVWWGERVERLLWKLRGMDRRCSSTVTFSKSKAMDILYVSASC